MNKTNCKWFFAVIAAAYGLPGIILGQAPPDLPPRLAGLESAVKSAERRRQRLDADQFRAGPDDDRPRGHFSSVLPRQPHRQLQHARRVCRCAVQNDAVTAW